MKIICPYYPEVLPETKECLKDYDVEFIKLDDSFGYYKLMDKLWKAQEGFVLVEHDTIFTPEQMEQLIDCTEHDWCGYGYNELSPEVSFGLCRFTKKHIQQIPDLWDKMVLHNWRDVCSHHGKLYTEAGFEPAQHKPHVINNGSLRLVVDANGI